MWHLSRCWRLQFLLTCPPHPPLPPALEVSSRGCHSLTKSCPSGEGTEKRYFCLSGCLSFRRAAGGSSFPCLYGQSQAGSAGLEALRPICYFTSRATVALAYSKLPLETGFGLCFGLAFPRELLLRGCFEVRWVYVIDFILPTDHRKTSRAQSEPGIPRGGDTLPVSRKQVSVMLGTCCFSGGHLTTVKEVTSYHPLTTSLPLLPHTASKTPSFFLWETGKEGGRRKE